MNFENYKYNGSWYRQEKTSFNGQLLNLNIQIDSDDNTQIPESGKNILLHFVDELDIYTAQIAEGIFEYYTQRRNELGYAAEKNDDYPKVTDSSQILNMVTLIGITIPDQEDYDEPAVFLVFDCTWDTENGVGVCMAGNTIDEVGFQDIAL